jgi:hypothetical protein
MEYIDALTLYEVPIKVAKYKFKPVGAGVCAVQTACCRANIHTTPTLGAKVSTLKSIEYSNFGRKLCISALIRPKDLQLALEASLNVYIRSCLMRLLRERLNTF